MPLVVRLGDLTEGACNCSPTPLITSSSNVFTNHKGQVRLGDRIQPHCSHDGIQITGSATVFVNKRKIIRKGDKISCGDKNLQTSPNVWAGG